MFIQPELRPCQTQSVISIPEQGKHSETHIAKSGVAIFHNPNIPITNYAEDFQTRLEVVSKLVPQEQVQRAYCEFVKKLNEICYETVAEQLVRSSRPTSLASSVYSQNTRPLRNGNVKNSDNGSDSTINRLYRAAEGVRKHLSTISESSNGEGLLPPKKQISRRNKSKTVHRDFHESMDNTTDHFRSENTKCKSRKIVSTKNLTKHITESSVEIIESEFNITKDSLRNSNSVVRKQKKNNY